MILLLAALGIGLFAGFIQAKIGGYHLNLPTLRLEWLVPVALLPQILIFYLNLPVPLMLMALGLVSSQGLLLIFAGVNRCQAGFWLLGLGLALNLLVITANGGLMPISPEMASKLHPGMPPEDWQDGQRLGTSKDIILPIVETHLWALSDRFFLAFPAWISYRVAFSLGDVLIALGACRFMWRLGKPPKSLNRAVDDKILKV